MSRQRKLRAAVIGLGVGQAHAKAFRDHPECELTHVCDFNKDSLEWASNNLPDTVRLCDTADQVLHDPEIDIVSICSWDNFHSEQVITALEQEKDVFVEKPLCLHADEARAIRKALTDHPSRKFSSNLLLRTSPRFLDLRERIARGELGELFYFDGDYNYGRVEKLITGWRGKIDHYSAICGGAIHLIDLFLWIHKSNICEVTAYGTGKATRGTAFRHCDTVVGILKFEDGAIGKVTANLGCVYPHFHRFSAYGTEATFEQTYGGAHLFKAGDTAVHDHEERRDNQYTSAIRIDSPYPSVDQIKLISDFVSAILENREPAIGREQALNAMSVCLALDASLQSGTSQPVEYI